MCRLYCLIATALVSSAAGLAIAADPFEINPAREEVIVDAKWGDQPSEFAWPGDNWGLGEVAGFGTFCLDSEGRVYIVDDMANAVKVFDQEGRWLHNVEMRKNSNIVSGIVVHDGRIYWFGETIPLSRGTEPVRKHYRVFSADATGKSSGFSEIALNQSLELSGGGFCDNCQLHVTADGIDLFARRGETSYPIVRAGEAVPVSEQATSKSRGLKSDGASIVFDYENDDIVRLGPGGSIEKVLVRSGGWLFGVAGNHFLTECAEEVRGQEHYYYELRDLDGMIVSRTLMPMPTRYSPRMIEITNDIQLSTDGTWYELYVDDHGVHVLRYHP
jgi:hypothetical protein